MTTRDLEGQGGCGEARRSPWREGRQERKQDAACRAGVRGAGGEQWWAEELSPEGQRRGHQSEQQGAEKKALLAGSTLCLRLCV